MSRLDVAVAIQAAGALFTALAATAAWRATIQVKKGRDDERLLRLSEQLKRIHGLVAALAESRPDAPDYGWQRPQLNLRAEVVVVFQPLPSCLELADAQIRGMDTQSYYDLVAKAMAEVEKAQQAMWKGRLEE